MSNNTSLSLVSSTYYSDTIISSSMDIIINIAIFLRVITCALLLIEHCLVQQQSASDNEYL